MKENFYFRFGKETHCEETKGKQKVGTIDAQFSRNKHQTSRRCYNQNYESYFNERNGFQIYRYIPCQQNSLTWLFYTPFDTTR